MSDGLTLEQGRAILVHYRDSLELSNRDMARAFQDRVSPDAFCQFLNGDLSALTASQQSYIGTEAAHWIEAEDLDREQIKRRGFTPPAGVREVIGFKK